MAKRRKKVVKGKFFIFLILLALCAGGVLLFVMSSGNDEVMTTASLSSSMDVESIAIRDENCYSAGKFDKAYYLADEGAQVIKDSPVAQVFKWGYSENTTQTLLNVQKEIYKEQLTINAGISIPELTAIDERLTQISEDVRAIVSKAKQGDLLTLEREVKALLESRAILLKDRTQPNEALNALYASEADKKKALSEWVSDYVAADAGAVSFYFDGYEQIMNADKLDLLNAELVKQIRKGVGYNTLSDDGSIIYRLVDSSHWYIAFLTDAASPNRLVEGEEYVVCFTGFSDTPYIGKAARVTVESASVLNIIEFNQEIGNFLSERTIKAQIRKDAAGMQVKTSAIKIIDGLCYIDVYKGENVERICVDVFAVSGEYAVVKAQAGQEALFEGQRYVG